MVYVALFPDAPMELAAELERVHRASFGGELAVGNRIADPRPAEFGRVLGVGGVRRDPVTDVPTVALEAWAETRSRAAALAQELRACLYALEGATFAGYTIGAVAEFAGPGDLPDPLSAQFRYSGTYAVTIRTETSVQINL